MFEWILKYWLEAGFGVVCLVIAVAGKKVFNWTKKWSATQVAIQKGLCALLRTQIREYYEKYIILGYCPIWVRDIVDDLFKQYTALGGNGTTPDLIDKLQILPTINPKGKADDDS